MPLLAPRSRLRRRPAPHLAVLGPSLTGGPLELHPHFAGQIGADGSVIRALPRHRIDETIDIFVALGGTSLLLQVVLDRQNKFFFW